MRKHRAQKDAPRARSNSRSAKQLGKKRNPGRPAVFSRDDIEQVAKTAFSQNGYANVTLDDLAARLKTGKGTLYYHLSRKVDLLISISRNIISASIGELRRIRALKTSPDVRFVLAMRSHMAEILADQQASKIYFENEADLPPPIKGELRSVLREIENLFEEIITEGTRTGVFKCDPHMSVKHVMAVCAWPYRWFSPEGRLTREEFIDTAVDFALSSLRTGSSLASVTDQTKMPATTFK